MFFLTRPLFTDQNEMSSMFVKLNSICTLVIASVMVLGISGFQVQAEDSSSKDEKRESQQRYVIIHADDAGMSHSVNMGTIAGLESGVVSSASIMVPCAWFTEFAKYARENPQHDYGIHLTLTSEWNYYRWGPVTSRDKVPSLVDEDGYLWDNSRLVAENVKADEVEIELRAQIDRARQFGVPLSHLDTHMGSLFSRPDLVEVYVKIGLEYDLPVLFMKKIPAAIGKEYPGLATGTDKLIKALEKKNLPLLDSVIQFYGGKTHEQRKMNYMNALRDMGPGVNELIIHCGYDNEELRAITNSASRRNGDRIIFSSAETAAFLKSNNIKLLNWKQFREMQCGKK